MLAVSSLPAESFLFFTFLSQNNNKLYFFFHEPMSRLAVALLDWPTHQNKKIPHDEEPWTWTRSHTSLLLCQRLCAWGTSLSLYFGQQSAFQRPFSECCVGGCKLWALEQEEKSRATTGQKQNYDTSLTFPPAQPPPPPNPFLTPHTDKKGVNLLRIQAAICLHSS